jgi:hypothetical protein
MPRYVAFSPTTEITGGAILAFITNINYDNIEYILRRHNLDKIDPKQWYSHQLALNVLSDISEGQNASPNFVAIGMAAGELGAKNLPPHMLSMTLIDFVTAYATVFQSRHRNGDAGYVITERIDNNHVTLRFKSPYPDDFMYGVLYGYARYYTGEKRRFTLRFDENHKRREQGGDETVLHLQLD